MADKCVPKYCLAGITVNLVPDICVRVRRKKETMRHWRKERVLNSLEIPQGSTSIYLPLQPYFTLSYTSIQMKTKVNALLPAQT